MLTGPAPEQALPRTQPSSAGRLQPPHRFVSASRRARTSATPALCSAIEDPFLKPALSMPMNYLITQLPSCERPRQSRREEKMKLTLGKKLGLGFGCVPALMVTSAVLTYMKARAIKKSPDHAMTARVPSVTACKDLQRDRNQTQSKGRQSILAGTDSGRREEAKKGFDATWSNIEKDVARMDELSLHWSLQADRDRLAEAKKHLSGLREIQEEIIKHAASGERDRMLKAGNENTSRGKSAAGGPKKTLVEMAGSFRKFKQRATEER